MIEEDKYYTPEINDWQDGLEYEYLKNGYNNWEKHTLSILWDFCINSPDGGYNGESPNNNESKFRVKYLDQSDIDSLGWNCLTEIPKESPIKRDGEKSATRPDLTFNKGIWWLFFNENGTVEIEGSMDEVNESVKTGELTIKNKSELHNLMKMIGI